ncbi:ECD protein, partial [Atractosteus spatula]|nr:ECD protein [Atractosteus spatula]
MDVLKRPPVAEDMVQYRLFLVQPNACDPQATQQLLQQDVERILVQFAPLLVQYIWQNQPFNIKYVPEKAGVPAHIGGSTQFGDNVEDEWFIVYLIQEITRTFPHLAARIEDNDGEFLLIEAAEHLPRWLNPESSENRVFLYRGELHIIPAPQDPGEEGWPPDATPTLPQALALLSSQPETCLAAQPTRTAVAKRVKGYPGRIQANLHRAHCVVPAAIASVLARRPDLVAPAVTAFYLRDPLDLCACRTFQIFPPDPCVLTSVTFTRCLYAQLEQQRFTPDRRSGFALPPRSHPQYHARELGMKLAHGFEILCSKCRQPSPGSDTPVTSNPLWRAFLDSLKKNNFFKGELEGSAMYRELMTKAESFFKQSVTIPQSSTELSSGEQVLQVLRSCQYNLEELREQESHLPPEDSDSWMEISPEQLDRLLEETAGHAAGCLDPNQVAGGQQESGRKEEADYSLVAVTKSMKAFINKVSTHEGAELPWSHSDPPFKFDANSMASALERLIGSAGEEELDSDDLEDSDIDEKFDSEDDEEPKEDGLPGEGAAGGGARPLGILRRYMEQMDQELAGTHIGHSFTQANHAGGSTTDPAKGSPAGANSSSCQTEEDTVPLDVDLNLVTNLLESLSSQAGLAGPASNLLQSMGIHLPPNTDHT